jgi:hypothetical protein
MKLHWIDLVSLSLYNLLALQIQPEPFAQPVRDDLHRCTKAIKASDAKSD